jgi:uncharacterized membrane protein SirB2
MVALLSTLTLLLVVGAAVTDPQPWLYAAVGWLALSIVATAVYVVVATVVKARRRARMVQVLRRHPSSRGWDW